MVVSLIKSVISISLKLRIMCVSLSGKYKTNSFVVEMPSEGKLLGWDGITMLPSWSRWVRH